MSKTPGDAVRGYHEATKHSYESVRMSPHFLEWDNQPLPFKLYRNVERVSLPDVSAPAQEPTEPTGIALSELARVLFYSAGVTRRRRFPGGEMLFRAAACTGALYHVEIYVVAGPLEGLDAGVYHFSPKDFGLSLLRRGEFRSVLVDACGGEPALARSPVALVLTSTFWRNAWKYCARAYRHTFWDSGTIYAHIEALAADLGFSAHLVQGFVDREVNALVDIDADREVSVALVALGRCDVAMTNVAAAVEPLTLETEPLSRTQVDYPLIRDAHESSSLASRDAVRSWRGVETSSRESPPSFVGLESVIRRRGSSRRFERTAIERDDALRVLESTLPAIDGDVSPLGDVYVIVNAVHGLSSGAYYYPRRDGEQGRGTLQLLQAGEFRDKARFLDLEQDLAGDASVNVYILASLDSVTDRYGDRGYRAAQLEGGILGGRMYLASYAVGLGATGLTFFDDAVTEFFSPHAAGKSVMFLLAFGVSAKRPARAQR